MVLDIEDDLHGQSCTLLTLQRIDWVINQLEQHYRFIADEGGLFYDNVGKSQQALAQQLCAEAAAGAAVTC